MKPLPWRELVNGLRGIGFEGPYQEGEHPYMVKENLVLTLPNPHRKDISVDLLQRILKQAAIKRDEWIERD